MQNVAVCVGPMFSVFMQVGAVNSCCGLELRWRDSYFHYYSSPLLVPLPATKDRNVLDHSVR